MVNLGEIMAELNKRKSALHSINRIATKVRSAEIENWDKVKTETELEQMERAWMQFSQAHDDLIARSADDAEIMVHQTVSDNALDTMTNAVVVMKRRVNDLSQQEHDAAQRANINEHTHFVAPQAVQNADEINRFLEKIKVPKFTGEQHKWLAFYKSFKSMVHDKNYSPVEKFHYLFNSLTDRARSVIGGLDTAESYDEAWNTLIKRYDNKRVIVNAHLQHFVGCTVSSKPGSEDLLALVDVTNLTVRSMRAMNIPVDEWDAIMVFLISRKLDNRTREFWESEQRSTDVPTLAAMLACLENRARTLQLAEEATPTVKQTTTNNQKNTRTGRQTVTSNTAVTNTATAQAQCELCKQEHWLHRCPQLLGAPIDQRFDMIKGMSGVCFNCLRVGHMKNECRSSGCKFCPNNQRHNSLLCRRNAQSSADKQQTANNAATISTSQ